MDELSKLHLAELRATFNFNDANGDGVLSFDEFVGLLIGLESGMSHDEARIGFEEIDTDRNGAIGFEEFLAWWTSD
jgi:Ca2+-binding EF-hand superfamily protein